MRLLEVMAGAPPYMGWIVSIAAVVGAAAVIWHKGLRPMFKLGHKINQTYEKVIGYDERLTKVEERSKQLVNNSGSSLKDAVDRIEKAQTAQTDSLATHIQWGQDELLKVWQALAARDTAGKG